MFSNEAASDMDSLFPLHHYPQFQDYCIKLLNSEWPISWVARVRSLERSCDDLPISLLLIDSTSSALIGYSCLCAVPRRPKDCWIQSVIVDTRFRGRGYGKRLMLASERYARENFGFEAMYLSTHDKTEFYRHLGYEICPPILHVGGNAKLLTNEKFLKFTGSISEAITRNVTKDTGAKITEDIGAFSNDSVPIVQQSPKSIPAPPPPPPAQRNGLAADAPVKVFMKKRIQ